MNNAIETTNLTKKFGDFVAVNNLNLKVEENVLYALLGVNGAGKTTTIKMLSCLSKPTSGKALVYGNDVITDSDKVKELINVAPQETAVATNLSVRENLEFFAEIYGVEKSQIPTMINQILKQLNLEDIANKKARLLSGGTQRRLSIGLSLISSPKLLFLDEPTLGVDVLVRRELWSFIKKLKEKMTIVLTTHYMEEAEELADVVGIMKEGQLIAQDTPKNLIEKTNSKNLEEAFIKLASKDNGGEI